MIKVEILLQKKIINSFVKFIIFFIDFYRYVINIIQQKYILFKGCIEGLKVC